jgi:K+-sensing histidine kinase KdpD
MNTLRALESSERILRRQAQIQEMLIAAISHDIKTPMRYLTIASEKMQGLLDKKDYESLPVFNKGIHETSSKMYILLDNLLQYIKVQLKRRDISIAPVLIGEVVQEKLLTFRNIAELHYTVIESQVPADIQINTNRELLGVIVHNLIDNAVKNTLSGKIVISTERFNKGIILVIKDTGKGIPQELAEWLNTPAETDEIDIDTASGHMGMGLVIVKELASMISAKIQVERPETGGTKIGITLLYHP